MFKRIFVAVTLPPAAKAYLKSQQQPNIRWIKWMKPENFHITLNFLGEVRSGELQMIKDILTEQAAAFPRFLLRISEIRQERDMLWLGPAEAEDLLKLQDGLKAAFAEAHLGKREKRDYYPHILLARSKTGRKMTWTPANFNPPEFPVNTVDLYESQLNPAGAIHTLLQSFVLGGAEPKT